MLWTNVASVLRRCSRAASATSLGSRAALDAVAQGWAAITAQATKNVSTAAASAYSRPVWLVIASASSVSAVGALGFASGAVLVDDDRRGPDVDDALGGDGRCGR